MHHPHKLFAVCFIALFASAPLADARTILKNICRVKGQEETTLHGLGLVVGLKGTGDGSDALPTIRALAKSMELMGNPVTFRPADPRGRAAAGLDLKELKDAKNVALVLVTAVVPPTGAQRGDKLDCQISAISAKSLAGGRLFLTPLLGPSPQDRRVYALAQGQVELDDVAKMPTAGKVHEGCRLEENFVTEFFTDGKILLVLDKNHADFQVAADVAELINSQLLGYLSAGESKLARALDQTRIEVPIPDAYLSDKSKKRGADPVLFVSEVLSLPIPEPQVEARVVINQRTGSIVVSGDVELGSVVVTHKNIVVEAGEQAAGRFVLIDPDDRALSQEEKAKKAQPTKLRALLTALNAVKVPPDDMIEIIKGLNRNGKLHGKLIIE